MLSSINPINKIIISFVLLITAGTFLLKIPAATHKGISFTDALFTSTSAVCVTGLTVLDTEKDFTFTGKVIILFLIQFGGLGIMTFSIAMILFMGGNFSIKWRMTFESFYNEVLTIPIRSVLKRIVLYTFTIEFVIAAILFPQFMGEFSPADAAWHSIFHSISAFCNAGFSTFSTSLIRYSDKPGVLLTISAAIIMGGLGFFVLTEIIKTRRKSYKRFFSQYSLHTKIVLTSSLILIAGGTAAFYLLEQNNTIAGMSAADRIVNSFMQSVTCRTAGFNSVDIAALNSTTLLMMIFLMFVGGAPGSIAGGIKVTTLTVMTGLLYSKLIGRKQVLFWGRSIDNDTLEKSSTLVILAAVYIITSTFILMVLNTIDFKEPFLSILFETTSAFNTVGLSAGITGRLTDSSKIILSIVMLTGRLGPFALIAALAGNKKSGLVEYPEEHIMIG